MITAMRLYRASSYPTCRSIGGSEEDPGMSAHSGKAKSEIARVLNTRGHCQVNHGWRLGEMHAKLTR
jgi:hypothetical protein